MIDKLLLGNLRFRESDFTPNIDYYKELAGSQHPDTLWIACSDSRLQTGHITQARAGELFIQRNIGNIVPIHDWNFATVLEYAVVHLKVSDVVICGHSNCGAIRALDKESTDAYIPLWLNNAREAKTRVDAKIKPPETVLEKEERYTTDRAGECPAPDRAPVHLPAPEESGGREAGGGPRPVLRSRYRCPEPGLVT